MDGVNAITKYAFVFSGQGSERVGMFTNLSKESGELEQMINQLKEQIGLDVSDIINSNDRDVIAANNQILLYIFHQLMSKLIVGKVGFHPTVCMGHSFGQFSAIANSGAVSFSDMAAFIRERHRIVNSPEIEVRALFKSIHGMTLDTFYSFQEKEGLKGSVELAIHNQKEQIVVAATKIGEEKLKELSAKYNFILKEIHVSRPYHTSFMYKYNRLLLPYINELNFSNPQFPILMNHSKQLIDDKTLLLEETKIQMVNPVFWYDSIEIVSNMVDAFVIVDPSETQLKIIKRVSNKKIYNVNNMGVLKMIDKRGL